MTGSTRILEQPHEELKTSLKDKFVYNDIICNHKGKESEKEDNSPSPYEQMRTKNESEFMKSIRSWEKSVGFVTPIVWRNAVAITAFHVSAVVLLIVSIARGYWPMWQTVVFGVAMYCTAGFGVTGGAHRYWSHRSFKAKKQLQLILLFCFTLMGQNSMFDWVRDHRVHHKFSESDADPHDARRGFFFSHVGWLMMKKHPEVIRRGNQVDMSDISSDPLIRFNTKWRHRRQKIKSEIETAKAQTSQPLLHLNSEHFLVIKLLVSFIVPTLVPVLCWGESWWWAVGSQPLLRYLLNLHSTWSVNSFAHMFGNKPYDESIMPAENWVVSIAAMGEGWHNYHHTFPWDYKAAEVPYTLNTTTVLLDLFRRVGWAYDAKQASQQLIRNVSAKKGVKEN